MAKLTPQEMAAKWSNRLSSATQDIQNGINRVTESPTSKAAAKQQKMINNLTAAVNSGKWAAGLNRVTLQDWKNATITKGVPRIAQGAQAAQQKFSDFATQLLAYQDSLSGQINKMPDLTPSDNLARMTAWFNGMSKFQKK
jgi:hypothetical protein